MRWFLPALLVTLAIATTTGGAGATSSALTVQGNCGRPEAHSRPGRGPTSGRQS